MKGRSLWDQVNDIYDHDLEALQVALTSDLTTMIHKIQPQCPKQKLLKALCPLIIVNLNIGGSKGGASPRSNSFSCSFWQKILPNNGVLPQTQGLPQPMSGKPWIRHCLTLYVIQIFPNEQPMMKSVLLWNNGGRQSKVVLYLLHKRQNLPTVKIYFFK